MVKDNSMLFCLIRVSTKKSSAMDNGCLWKISTFFVSNSRVVEFARISAQVVVGIKLSSPKMAALISRQTLQTPHSQAKISRELSTSREVYNSSKSDLNKFCGIISFMHSLEFLFLSMSSSYETNIVLMGSPGNSSRLVSHRVNNDATGCTSS